MQQKMMKWMTIFMGLLFYKVASGLCLYFIASSLWGIAERKMLGKSNVSPTGTPESKSTPIVRQTPTGQSDSTERSNGSRAQKRPKAKRRK
jgi:YidC/Oxa1 family membrane protein insertase